MATEVNKRVRNWFTCKSITSLSAYNQENRCLPRCYSLFYKVLERRKSKDLEIRGWIVIETIAIIASLNG